MLKEAFHYFYRFPPPKPTRGNLNMQSDGELRHIFLKGNITCQVGMFLELY
jgi:hypothetical protein